MKSTNRQVRVSLFYCSRCTYRHARSNHYVNQWINPPWCLTFFHYGHLWTNGQCQTTTSLCLSANLLPVFLKSISSAEGCTCVFPLFSPVCLFLFVPPAPTIHSPTEEVTERGGGGGGHCCDLRPLEVCPSGTIGCEGTIRDTRFTSHTEAMVNDSSVDVGTHTGVGAARLMQVDGWWSAANQQRSHGPSLSRRTANSYMSLQFSTGMGRIHNKTFHATTCSSPFITSRRGGKLYNGIPRIRICRRQLKDTDVCCTFWKLCNTL